MSTAFVVAFTRMFRHLEVIERTLDFFKQIRRDSPLCFNGGTRTGGSCVCPPFFYGEECKEVHCGLFMLWQTLAGQHGRQDFKHERRCACDSGYTGSFCQFSNHDHSAYATDISNSASATVTPSVFARAEETTAYVHSASLATAANINVITGVSWISTSREFLPQQFSETAFVEIVH